MKELLDVVLNVLVAACLYVPFFLFIGRKAKRDLQEIRAVNNWELRRHEWTEEEESKAELA